jgi:hypothetical protein
MVPIIVPSLLKDLVDPQTRSRPRHTKELQQAMRKVLSVLPYEQVPDKEWSLLHSPRTLNHWGRLHLAGFLWSNGINPRTIRLILRHSIRSRVRRTSRASWIRSRLARTTTPGGTSRLGTRSI